MLIFLIGTLLRGLKMSLKVIKFVAGGGKTTESLSYLKANKNGIYLAFNNKVVDEISNKGCLSKTIDSLFVNYIIPKLVELVPLISNGCKIEYINTANLNNNLKGIANIHIHKDGKIFNRKTATKFDLSIRNTDLHNFKNEKNLIFLKNIFCKDKLVLTDQLRADLSSYLINQYQEKIISLMEKRFSFVIVDEAQDLKDFREEFVKLISDSKIDVIVLGDVYQNINGGGKWFGDLNATKSKNKSFRCPDNICKWLREKLGIEIYGNQNHGEVIKIHTSDVLKYDDSKRFLLYYSKSKLNKNIIENWSGPKSTIKKAKGETIDSDIVIIGKKLDFKNSYTAITRTCKTAYITFDVEN